VHHERAFMPGPIGDTLIHLTLETRGREHIEELVKALRAKGTLVA
jgi:threonine dehydratase